MSHIPDFATSPHMTPGTEQGVERGDDKDEDEQAFRFDPPPSSSRSSSKLPLTLSTAKRTRGRKRASTVHYDPLIALRKKETGRITPAEAAAVRCRICRWNRGPDGLSIPQYTAISGERRATGSRI